MVKKWKSFLAVVLWFACVCCGVVTGYTSSDEGKQKLYHVRNPVAKQAAIKRTWTPRFAIPVTTHEENNGPHLGKPMHNSYSNKNTKKSDLPEKGQIKFMKSLLGKVRKLLNHGKPKATSSVKKAKEGRKENEKVTSVGSSNGNLYGVLGKQGAKEEDVGKSVNVISIPLDALGKISKNEHSDSDQDRSAELSQRSFRNRGGEVVPGGPGERSDDDDDTDDGEEEETPSTRGKRLGRVIPLVFQNGGDQLSGGTMMVVNPETRTLQPLEGFANEQFGGPVDSRRPSFPKLLRYGAITNHARDDDTLYRDIGHIPGESKFMEHPSSDNGVGKTSLRHKRPANHISQRLHLHPQVSGNSRDDDEYDDDDDDDDNDDDDDEYDDDDDDDDEEDDDEDDGKNDERMSSEEREIAARRKRLLSMLPGNDPTLTSENKGLGLGVMGAAAPQMPIPEAFLGNPMLRLRGGTGFAQSRNMFPFPGAAMVGEHADNANDRNVFMLGGRGEKQAFDNSQSNDMSYNDIPSPVRVGGNGGFTLGGSPAQAMSPNEVSFLLQRPGPNDYNQLSQKDRISRPKGSGHRPGNVLLEVNGRPIGDSKELRSHVVNGRVTKGKEKIIKSKGPVNVRISKARDGIHSKVVEITSSDKVKVLEAKSKIAKSQ